MAATPVFATSQDEEILQMLGLLDSEPAGCPPPPQETATPAWSAPMEDSDYDDETVGAALAVMEQQHGKTPGALLLEDSDDDDEIAATALALMKHQAVRRRLRGKQPAPFWYRPGLEHSDDEDGIAATALAIMEQHREKADAAPQAVRRRCRGKQPAPCWHRPERLLLASSPAELALAAECQMLEDDVRRQHVHWVHVRTSCERDRQPESFTRIAFWLHICQVYRDVYPSAEEAAKETQSIALFGSVAKDPGVLGHPLTCC